MNGGWLFLAIIFLGVNFYNFLDSQDPWAFLSLMMCVLMCIIIYREMKVIADSLTLNKESCEVKNESK